MSNATPTIDRPTTSRASARAAGRHPLSAGAVHADVPAEVLGTLINLAGRQRMLSQRIVLHVVLATQGWPDALTTAREALQQFEASHCRLVEGGDGLPGVFCDALRQAYFGPGAAQQRIRDFTAAARRAIEGAGASGAGRAALDALVRATSPVLALLQGITQVYEEEARRRALVQKQQQRQLMERIEDIARQAHVVSFNAQIIAARAGTSGREFSVVAGVLSDITREMEHLVQAALQEPRSPGSRFRA